jgi:5-methylcytosine-specific restriction endonuclease McrA
MTITTRAESRQAGETYYFIGEECKNGHIADRLVTSNACLECIQERNEMLEYNRTQASEDKASRKIKAKESVQYARSVLEFLRETTDPDSPESVKLLEMELDILPKSREIALYLGEKFYYDGVACEQKGHLCKRITKSGICVECVKNYGSWYRQEYKEEYRAHNQNRRARVKQVGGTFTAKDISDLHTEQDGYCNGCWELLEILGYHVDHVIPISKGGSNWPDNLQLLCPTCNLEKSAKMPEEWEKIARIKRKESKRWKTMKNI